MIEIKNDNKIGLTLKLDGEATDVIAEWEMIIGAIGTSKNGRVMLASTPLAWALFDVFSEQKAIRLVRTAYATARQTSQEDLDTMQDLINKPSKKSYKNKSSKEKISLELEDLIQQLLDIANDNKDDEEDEEEDF